MMSSSSKILCRRIPRSFLYRSINTEIKLPPPSHTPQFTNPPEHPQTPSSSSLSISVSPPQPYGRHPHADFHMGGNHADQEPRSNLPSPPKTHHQPAHLDATPPFHTHHFLVVLEKTFPTQTARGLMRATRALIIDRLGRVRRDALGVKDLDNQAYLFRAALSELRTESTLRRRNESAAISTSLAALRRDFDALNNKMKADIDNMKHEIQMEVDNRKNESKADMKQQDIVIEEVLNKAIVTLGELRTVIEEVKWENMRKAVVTLGAFVLVLVLSTELRSKPKPPVPHPAMDVKHPEGEGLERMDWVT